MGSFLDSLNKTTKKKSSSFLDSLKRPEVFASSYKIPEPIKDTSRSVMYERNLAPTTDPLKINKYVPTTPTRTVETKPFTTNSTGFGVSQDIKDQGLIVNQRKAEEKRISDERQAQAKIKLKEIDAQMKALRNKQTTTEEDKLYDDLRVERFDVQATAKPIQRGIFDAATSTIGKVLGVKDTKDLATGDISLTPNQETQLTESEQQLKESGKYKVGGIGTQLALTASQYSVINNALAGTKLGTKLTTALGSKFAANQAVDQLADRIIQAPNDWLPLIKGEKTWSQTMKDLALAVTIDAALNLVVGAKGGLDELNAKRLLKNTELADNVNKQLKNLPPEQAKTIQQELGLGEVSAKDYMKTQENLAKDIEVENYYKSFESKPITDTIQKKIFLPGLI